MNYNPDKKVATNDPIPKSPIQEIKEQCEAMVAFQSLINTQLQERVKMQDQRILNLIFLLDFKNEKIVELQKQVAQKGVGL